MGATRFGIAVHSVIQSIERTDLERVCSPQATPPIGLCGKVGNYVQTFRDSNNCTNFQVAWLRATDQTVLALQDLVVSHNNRISISHEGMHTFRLRIKQIRESDKGCYMCQINSSPMKKEIGCIDVQGKHFSTATKKVSLSIFSSV